MHPLRLIPMFASLDEASFTQLVSLSRIRTYHSGEILFFEGERPKALLVLSRGTLKLYKSMEGTKEIVLHRFTPVSLIAERTLLQRIPFPASAVFESDGETIEIDAVGFESLFLENSALSRVLIASLSDKIRTLEQVIEHTLTKDAAERVLEFVGSSGALFASMRHYDIAHMLHLTPETLSRTLKKLLREGHIRKEGKGYCLP
ncbi:MAG: Crp/Fnr family transcriptional regulator [Campylobacterales bacterium]|nr:Crp/Fnr family transcriptional regulator [Campylobacterales bacterium]